MKRRRFTTEQIILILNEAQLGIRAKDLCHKYGISPYEFIKERIIPLQDGRLNLKYRPIEWGKVNLSSANMTQMPLTPVFEN